MKMKKLYNKIEQLLLESFDEERSKQLLSVLEEGNVETFVIIVNKQKNLPLKNQINLEVANFLIKSGEADLAIPILRRILKEKDVAGEAFYLLGEINSREGRWNKAIKFIHNSIDKFRAEGKKGKVAKCLNLLGTIYGDKGDLIKANDYFSEAVRNNSHGDEELKNTILINMGIINLMLEKYALAIEKFMEAREYFKLVKNVQRLGEIDVNLSIAYLKKCNFKKSYELAEKCIKSGEEFRLKHNVAIGLLVQGEALVHLQQYDKAGEILKKALEAGRRIKDRLLITDIYRVKGIRERELKNYNKAGYNLLTGLKISREIKSYLEADILNEIKLLKQHKEEMGIFEKLTGEGVL
jgi:tetratricopeptide (TPR) repeat protein